MRQPTREELSPLFALNRKVSRLQHELRGAMMALEEACDVPPGCVVNPATGLWMGPDNKPLAIES
ncbi:MAG: hypothetical protein GY835_23880 [bacterium]|nr:hypothetical protein [bacterium]